MKKYFALAVAGVIASALVLYVHAQSFGTLGLSPIAPTVAGCQAPTAGQALVCPVGSTAAGYQTYVSYNGGGYAPLGANTTTLPFSAITGTLAPSTQLPATVTCTFTAAVGSSNTLVLTGCH